MTRRRPARGEVRPSSTALVELHHQFLAARRTTRRLTLTSSSGVRAAQWDAWNAAIDSAVSIADQIAREPAASFADFSIKIEALHWWCVEFDAFSNIEGFRRLTAFESELKRLARRERSR